MTPTNAQFADIQKKFPNVKRTDCIILFEGGSDNEESTHFIGDFIASVQGSIYRFNDNGEVKKMRY